MAQWVHEKRQAASEGDVTSWTHGLAVKYNNSQFHSLWKGPALPEETWDIGKKKRKNENWNTVDSGFHGPLRWAHRRHCHLRKFVCIAIPISFNVLLVYMLPYVFLISLPSSPATCSFWWWICTAQAVAGGREGRDVASARITPSRWALDLLVMLAAVILYT